MVDKKWYCVRTQTKREKLAAAKLNELENVDVFCPLLRYRKATRRGKIWWEEALFPSYVLACFDIETDLRNVEFCRGVSGLVKFGMIVPHMSHGFIETLQREWNQVAEQGTLTVKPQFEIGDEVELATGPFQGMKGIIIEIQPSSERIKLLLEFLGNSQAVDCDLFSILMPRRPLPSL
jgi:transcriptional antiterminator RfaH